MPQKCVTIAKEIFFKMDWIEAENLKSGSVGEIGCVVSSLMWFYNPDGITD